MMRKRKVYLLCVVHFTEAPLKSPYAICLFWS
jgi:hypothetical protein